MTAAFARLSTGMKMLVILATALLPLGLIALIASIQSANSNRLLREAETQLAATAAARQISAATLRGSVALATVAGRQPLDTGRCGLMLDARVAGDPTPPALALFDWRGRLLCASARFSGLPATPPERRIGTEALLSDDPAMLRFITAADHGRFGVGELDYATLGRIVRQQPGATPAAMTLVQGTARLRLVALPDRPLEARMTASAPLVGGQLALEVTAQSSPITALEMLMILLPLLMWLAAAIIGWLVLDRLLLKPLAVMQRAVNAYRPGDGPLSPPRIATPAIELRQLGDAFARVTGEIARHDAEIAEALDRQVRLTREVHHRVKNNLQVVASLINLHARGAPPEAADAYASIQRRVDALSVVHRNHFAELEENRGVSLRALIGELASNLRATAPPDAGRFGITLDVASLYTTQDVAVPIAFLITEVVELAMVCAPDAGMAITLQPAETPARAMLAISSTGLAGSACMAHPGMERFRRIVGGLTRQLRSRLDIDDETGRYAIEIMVVGRARSRSFDD